MEYAHIDKRVYPFACFEYIMYIIEKMYISSIFEIT